MSAESDYMRRECDNVLHTIDMIEQLLGKKNLSDYETIALGKLLQDVYIGIERVLRSWLEQHGIKTQKTESWHKELLLKSQQQSLVSEEQFKVFRDLLLFRHLNIHGYGYMLDKERLCELARPIPAVTREFLSSLL